MHFCAICSGCLFNPFRLFFLLDLIQDLSLRDEWRSKSSHTLNVINEHKENIEKANSFHSSMIKKERQAVIQQKGQAVDMDFRDQRLKVQQQSNEQYKAKFRR